MQKFNDILNNIELIMKKTQSISDALNNGDFELENLETISNLYDEREKIIIELKSSLETELGKDFLTENKQLWEEKINLILNLDSANLELLRKKTKETGEKLKSLQRQKSVLIYSK